MGDEGVKRIVESGLLKRLEVLDLRHGCVTDEGARVLAGCPDTRRLRVLDLNRNHMTSAGVEILKGLGIEARVEDQWGMGNDGYFESYLQEGDFE
jgi:Ran GTPase-activating protein (RanGAP) involved in mRNA processing and transport